MKKRIAAATSLGLSIVLLSGCTPFTEAMYVAQDIKRTSDEHEEERHEERVDELNREYQEFLKSEGNAGHDDERANQSIVIMQDDIETD